MRACPVSSCSSRARRRRSSSCPETTRRSASRATRRERSTAIAARLANCSARRRSALVKQGSRPLVVRHEDADRTLARQQRHVETRRGARRRVTSWLTSGSSRSESMRSLLPARARVRSSSHAQAGPAARSAIPSPSAAAIRKSAPAGSAMATDGRRWSTQPGRNEVEQGAELELADERSADLVQRFELL